MNILAIGNSFSQDATRYLHEIMQAGRVPGRVVNLYIGGCSLERHWNNVRADAADYEYELNGQFSGRMSSIRQALDEGGWDVITLQQVSGLSGIEDTYYPYIDELIDYVKARAPKARLMLHKTWAYEQDSTHADFPNYDSDQRKMYDCICKTCDAVSKHTDLSIIPCGDAVQAARAAEPFVYENGGMSLCRDGFHMSLVYGRYLLGAVWYETLTGQSVLDNGYVPCAPLAPEGVAVDDKVLDVLRGAAHKICTR